MKRIRNFVIGGIESKVFNLILITVLLTAAAFMAGFWYQNRMLAELSNKSSQKQQESIAKTTGTIMDEVVNKSLSQNTEMEALIADELFSSLRHRVYMIEHYTSKLFNDPLDAQPMPYEAPDPARDGEVTAQVMYADGVDKEALDLSVSLIANMSEMMISLFDSSAETNSCFVALPEGAFLVVDDRSASKYDENGDPISYDPRTRPWYKLAVEKRGVIYTDVEVDAFTGDIGIVCAMPVYVDGELVAVVGSDLFLTSMRDAVADSGEDGGFVCVLNQYGHVVFSPQTEGIFQVHPSNDAIDLRESENKELASLVKDAMKGKTEVRTVELDDGTYYMNGAPMKTVGWTLLSVLSKSAVDRPADMLLENYQEIQTETENTYLDKLSNSRRTVMILLLFVTLLTLGGALTLGRRIVNPLNKITRKIRSLNGKNPEFKMEDTFRTGDEIEVLAESFAKLSHRTLQYVDEVKKVTAEKERISTELHMANQIQESMLPNIFPPFPDRKEFDIFATMDPAREVGGDFYDFFLIDDDHLCLVIADVSGKGVPAALFMMISKIIIQSCAMLGRSAGEILTKTNEALCSNNKMEMFVTVWLGILEISTGHLKAANAGHEYPALFRSGEKFELFKDKHGLVIGALDDVTYREYELDLQPGDKIFLYTDGVAEAINEENELFGTTNMLEALNEEPDAHPRELLENVHIAVDEFSSECKQFDDLTMMCLEYKGCGTD